MFSKRTKRKLVFETDRKSRRGSARRFWIILPVAILVVLVLSSMLILKQNNYDVNAALGIETETTTEKKEETTKPVTATADDTFLFWCASADRQEIYFMNIIRVTLPECSVVVSPVDLEEIISENRDGGKTAEEIYLEFGENGLVSAVEDFYSVEIDRYAGATDTKLKTMVNYFGGFRVTVDEQINYRSEEMNLVLIKGSQNMKGDTLFKYLRYLSLSGEEGRRRQARTVIEILENVFNEGNVGKRERIYNEFANTFITDITKVDYSKAEDGIVMLMNNGILRKTVKSNP